MKIVIIGGSSSGLFAALKIKNEDNEVLVLDHNDELGKKILVTGNGRCNYWNSDMDNSHFHSNNDLSMLLNDDIKGETLNTFNDLGILPLIKNGYYYPYSNQATTIRDMFIQELDKRNISYKLNYDVNKIEYVNNKYLINDEIEADKVIISAGGKASPVAGSNGSIMNIINDLGIKTIKQLPSLVPLYTDGEYNNFWNGIRTNAKLSIYIDGELVKEEQGELQLTQNGISGICVFNISRYASIALDEGKHVNVKIDFIPDVDDVISYASKFDLNIYEILSRILNKKLVKIILDKADINSSAHISSLTSKEISSLNKYIKEFSVNVIGVGDFNKAQTTIGGVDLNELDSNLESIKYKGLYFVGEVVDVDGDCGGYNLGFAWMSALIVSKAINR